MYNLQKKKKKFNIKPNVWLKDESELNNIITAYGKNIFLPNLFISPDTVITSKHFPAHKYTTF